MPRIYVATRTVRELVPVMFRTVAITVALVVGASAPATGQLPEGMEKFLAQRYAQLDSIAARSPTFAAALDSLRGHFILVPVGAPGTIAAVREEPDSTMVAVWLNYQDAAELEVTRDEWEYILVHELYGHALPLLRGDTCPDPLPGQQYRESCVAKRAAVVLRELGREPPRTYGLVR